MLPFLFTKLSEVIYRCIIYDAFVNSVSTDLLWPHSRMAALIFFQRVNESHLKNLKIDRIYPNNHYNNHPHVFN